MSAVRRIVFNRTADAIPAPVEGVVHVVLDTAWTPSSPDRRDVVALRDLVGPVLDRSDLFEEAFLALDAWAEDLDLAGRMTVEGISWWFRRRMWTWLWLAERVHWTAILEELTARQGLPGELQIASDEPTLIEIATAFAERRGIHVVVEGANPPQVPRRESTVASQAGDGLTLVDRLRWRLGRHPRQRRVRELGRRAAVLNQRVAALREAGRARILVLTSPTVHQVVATDGGPRRMDAFLGPVVARLERSDLVPITLALRTDARDDAAWLWLAADPAILPDSLLASQFARPEDDAAGDAAGVVVGAALEAMPRTPLEIGGIDFAPAIKEGLTEYAGGAIPGRVRAARRGARLVEDLGVAAIVLIDEYGQTEWIAAGRTAHVPVLAVQHGIIIPQHVGYRHRRHASLALPTKTLVFGPYEARVLSERGGYSPDEIEVSGAPRLDVASVTGREAIGEHDRLDGQDAAERERDRTAIRTRLGVHPDYRMLVISTTHEPVHRRFYWPHALGRLLAGPLPGTHLVFKLHPAEADDGMYRTLVEGLAARHGHAPPPLTIVRDVDLFQLLRAADAHLGLYSTVLTDAVVAGIPNLIAATQARTDLLGYVAAGVARPVRDAAELRAFLEDPTPPDPADRQAFLDDHFRAGDASERIRAAIERAIATATEPGASPGHPGDEGNDARSERPIAAGATRHVG